MAPSKEKQSSNVFIRDDVYGWRPAVQLKINGDKAIVTVAEYRSEQTMACDGGRNAKKGETREINLKEYPSGVLPLQNVDANGNLVECPDMVKLPYLHEVRQFESNDLVLKPKLLPLTLSVRHKGCDLVQYEKASH